jgi:hypothetical protein
MMDDIEQTEMEQCGGGDTLQIIKARNLALKRSGEVGVRRRAFAVVREQGKAQRPACAEVEPAIVGLQ